MFSYSTRQTATKKSEIMAHARHKVSALYDTLFLHAVDMTADLGLHCCSDLSRALDKRGYLMIIEDNYSYFSLKPYVMTPNLNCPDETVQMRGHNICFYADLTKIIPNHHQILPFFRALSICIKTCNFYGNSSNSSTMETLVQ